MLHHTPPKKQYVAPPSPVDQCCSTLARHSNLPLSRRKRRVHAPKAVQAAHPSTLTASYDRSCCFLHLTKGVRSPIRTSRRSSSSSKRNSSDAMGSASSKTDDVDPKHLGADPNDPHAFSLHQHPYYNQSGHDKTPPQNQNQDDGSLDDARDGKQQQQQQQQQQQYYADQHNTSEAMDVTHLVLHWWTIRT